MPRVKLHPVVPVVYGKYGDMVFQRRHGKVFLIQRADFEDYTPTDAQKSQRERFRRAAAYGKSVLADEAARALYAPQAEREDLTVYTVASRDYLRAPVLEELDLTGYHGAPGDTIRVRATDDFEVVRVTVEIRDDLGAVLESGEAQCAADDRAVWLYRATAAAPAGATVSVTAADRPGNRTQCTAGPAG